MNKSSYPYDESLLQWVWEQMEFSPQGLVTEDGRSVRIVKNGRKNTGAGPDFTSAHLVIGDLSYHGDVEIHIDPGHWNAHHHQQDERFNRVILHVVYDINQSRDLPIVKRKDGTTPPLLVLKPYLKKSLRSLFHHQAGSNLPCSGNLSFLNQQAFEEQVTKAHSHYFNYKTGELLKEYDPSQPPSQAWLQMLAAGIYKTLGISRNCEPMEMLFEHVNNEPSPPEELRHFIDFVKSEAFSGDSLLSVTWETTGMRPASRPSVRVEQAAAIHFSLLKIPFSNFLAEDLSAWNKTIQSIPVRYLPGKQMRQILRQTIFLPAAYLLGDILLSRALKQNAFGAWQMALADVPPEIKQPFQETGFLVDRKIQKLGLAHQLKRYCRCRQCHRCEVFKKAISS